MNLNGNQILGHKLFINAFVQEEKNHDQNVLKSVLIDGGVQMVVLNNFYFKRLHIIQNAEAGTLVFANRQENNPRDRMNIPHTITKKSTVTTVEVNRPLFKGFFYIVYSHPNSNPFDLSILLEFLVN